MGHAAEAFLRRLLPDKTAGLATVVILAGAALRLWHLDADPAYGAWLGYIPDEGRWVEGARGLVLHDAAPTSLSLLHLAVAPLFEAAAFVAFQLFGVSIWSSRIFSALSGSAILVLLWLMLIRSVSPGAAVFGLALLAFQPDFFAISRLAIPAVPSMLLELTAYWLITEHIARGHKDRVRTRLLLAGLITAAAVGVKLSSAYFALIGAAIVVVADRREVSVRERLVNVVAYGLPLIGVAAFGALLLLEGAEPRIGDLGAFSQVVSQLVRPAAAFQIVNRLFDGGFLWTVSVWATGLWLSILVWAARTVHPVTDRERTHLIASAIWIGLYTPLILALAYFPVYYAIHILIPMAVCVSCGLSIFLRIGPSAIATGLLAKRGLPGIVWRMLLVAPSAVFLGSPLLQLWGVIGFDHTRLSRTAIAVVASVVVLTTFATLMRDSTRLISFFLAWPPLCLSLLVLSSTVASVQFWPGAADKMALAVRVSALVLMAVLAANVRLLNWERRRWAQLSVVAAALVFGSTAIKAASLYVTPRYTLLEASRDLGQLLADCDSIASVRSEGLFNNNRLPYGHSLGLARCVVVRQVVVGNHLEPIMLRDEVSGATSVFDEHQPLGYELLKTYPLWVDPAYCRPRGIAPSACEMRVNAFVPPGQVSK
jgi:hypothetical protein